MTLHIFNPDHDLALAANLANFTAPHAGRELRADVAFLPALWAEEGDWVLVEDVESTTMYANHLSKYLHRLRFLTLEQLATCHREVSKIEVWGWNKALCRQLQRAGVSPLLMPTPTQLEAFREVSNRQWASEHLLKPLVQSHERLTGEAVFLTGITHLQPQTVLKSPWSSSGRGVKYVESADDQALLRWAERVVGQQGGIMQEPYYKKVTDFAMEFQSDGKGRVHYLGLSLFQTVKGAYTGNLIATEEEKRSQLEKYIPESLLIHVRSRLEEMLSYHLGHLYEGPLGVDMMIVAPDNASLLQLHPCVELNLRRTMGHVALALTPKQPQPWLTMRIKHTDRYRLHIAPYMANTVNTQLA